MVLGLAAPLPFWPSAGKPGAGMFSLSFSSAVFSAAGVGVPLAGRFSFG